MIFSDWATWTACVALGAPKLGARKPVAMRAYRLVSGCTCHVGLKSQLTFDASADFESGPVRGRGVPSAFCAYGTEKVLWSFVYRTPARTFTSGRKADSRDPQTSSAFVFC